MQKLTNLINETRKKAGVTDQNLLNLIREYLQVLILKAIYQSKYGRQLSFVGGTCLRICYNLKRFSEDLDFTLDHRQTDYSFADLHKVIASYLKNTDFEVDFTVSEDKVVQKSFVRISRVLHVFGLSPMNSQKLHIKLEIDTNPVPASKNELASYFVTKFEEIFPILKHTDQTLFAGKICAALNRLYTKGRDFYDLIWYLNRGTKINFNYLNKSFNQAGLTEQFKDEREVIEALKKRMATVKINDIMKDIGRFLEDPSEETWLKNYPAVFQQAAERYLNKS